MRDRIRTGRRTTSGTKPPRESDPWLSRKHGKENFPSMVFPPLEPRRAAWLGERNLRLIAAHPGLDDLRNRLLDIGGQEVCFYGPEFDLAALLKRGRDFSMEKVEFRDILGPNECHSSAALAWLVHRGKFEIATGYALSDDGLWRQHSWGVEDRRVIESTVSRVRYFGFMLSREEADRFASSNLTPKMIAMVAENMGETASPRIPSPTPVGEHPTLSHD